MADKNSTLFGLTQATLLDVDLPFVKLLPVRPLVGSAQLVEIALGQDAFQIRVTPFQDNQEGEIWVRMLDEGLCGEILEHRFLQSRMNRNAERRIDPRHKTTLAVSSPDLPNSRATTYDISEFGMRLVTEEPVPVGANLRLLVEQESQDPVLVEGEAVWTVPRVNSLHHVGVRLRP